MGFKKYYLTILLLGFLLLGTARLNAQQYQVQDSFAMEIPLLNTFSKIVVSDGVTLIYNQSLAEGLAISASSTAYIQNLKVEVVGDTLKVGLKKFLKDGNLLPKYKVYAASSGCTFIYLTNAGRLIILGDLNSDTLNVIASNAAKIDAEISVKSFNLELSSASLAQVKGNVAEGAIIVKDASKMMGSELKMNTAQISAAGASKIFVTVKDQCKINASGASKIYLKGNPVVLDKKLSGMSKLIKNN